MLTRCRYFGCNRVRSGRYYYLTSLMRHSILVILTLIILRQAVPDHNKNHRINSTVGKTRHASIRRAVCYYTDVYMWQLLVTDVPSHISQPLQRALWEQRCTDWSTIFCVRCQQQISRPINDKQSTTKWHSHDWSFDPMIMASSYLVTVGLFLVR